jgi:2-polyprenyl-6-methoxyphenol hydroxylase-like FAD-dependent oxidoreductase
VLLNTQVRVLEATKAVGLTGDTARVTGVRVEREGREQTLKADIVVDASGGRTKSPAWLADLGLPPLEQTYVDPGLAYAGRVFEAPSDAPSDFPGVLIQPNPGTGRPGAGGAFMPQEDGRWIVALVGTAGGQPPTDEEGFQAFARGLPHPIIADLLATAKPLTPIRGSRGLANRRRHFERLKLPAGLVALGDAVMVLSPNYASGMSIAALGALALRTELKKSGLVPDLGARVQAEVAKAGLGPWTTAAGADRWYPGAETNVTARGGAMQQRMAARFTRAAAERPEVLRAMYEMASLRATQRTAVTLPVLISALRRPSKPQLSADEAIAQFPEIGHVLSRTPSPNRQAVRRE